MEAWQQAFDAGRHTDALPLIAALVAAYPQEPALHFRHAQTLRELGRFDAALTALNQLLTLRPNVVPALLQQAELQALLGDAEASEASLRRAVSVDPRHAEARVRLAAFLLDRGDWRLAGYELDQALALDPGSTTAAALRERLRQAAVSAPAPAKPAVIAPAAAAESGTGSVRLLIDELPVASAGPVAAPVMAAAVVLPELPADELQQLLDAHWASLRQDEDRLAATVSHAALLLAWAPRPTVRLGTPVESGREADGLRALGYRPLGTLHPAVHLPFAPPVRATLFLSADARVLALQARLLLPKVSLMERLWLRLTGRWQHIELMELCSRLGEGPASAELRALVLSNNLGGQVPFQELPPVHLQRYSRRASAKALDILHRERIEVLREELGGCCLPLEDAAAAEALLSDLHQRRRQGRQQLGLLRDEELQRFLGTHYTRVAGRVYRQLEALQQDVQALLAAQASRASEPA